MTIENRCIDIFDFEQACVKHATTHVHAYLRACADNRYTVFVTRYRDMGDGVRGYPLGSTRTRDVEAFARYSAKRLTQLASDPQVLAAAHELASMEA